MAVVINEFQVMTEPAPAPPAASAGEAREAPAEQQLDECAIARLLRARQVNALRVWAH